MNLVDLSLHNIGEAIYDANGKYLRTEVRYYKWYLTWLKGFRGAIVKCSESTYSDAAYDVLAATCTLPYLGPYHYVGYSKKYYTPGKEEQYADDQTQKIISQVDKYRSKINIKIALDFEQNANWEPIENTNVDRVIDRCGLIVQRIVENIAENEKYFPILYTNQWNLTFDWMKNITNCPLWIAMGSTKAPKLTNWTDYDIRQYSWKGSGKQYGNFTGNQWVDLNNVKHLNNILIPA